MREIKFRGKSTGDLGTWIYGYYHCDAGKHYICSFDKLIRYEVIGETVGQYTGQRDIDGEHIYEGQSLTCEHGYTGVVKWDNGILFQFPCFYIQWDDGDKTAFNDAAHLDIKIINT